MSASTGEVAAREQLGELLRSYQRETRPNSLIAGDLRSAEFSDRTGKEVLKREQPGHCILTVDAQEERRKPRTCSGSGCAGVHGQDLGSHVLSLHLYGRKKAHNRAFAFRPAGQMGTSSTTTLFSPSPSIRSIMTRTRRFLAALDRFAPTALVLCVLALLAASTSAQPQDPTWDSHYQANGPRQRWYHPMAYDTDRDVAVIFGGASRGVWHGDLWEWDGTTWTEQVPQGSQLWPPKVLQSRLVYDRVNKRMILFGGSLENRSGFMTGTWAWSPASKTWSILHPSNSSTNSPFGRQGHSMVYFEDQNGNPKILVSSGEVWDSSVNWRTDDTWLFDCTQNTWTDITTSTSPSPQTRPSPRTMVAAAWSPDTNKILFYGGSEHDATTAYTLNETWSFDCHGLTWESLSATGPDPTRESSS